MTLNSTPSANRIHIGVFGRTNSGKSSFINAFSGQNVSITANVAGTTTDPIYKPMEINPIGPCVIIDTAGLDDKSELGKRRIEKTKLAAEKSDVAIIVISSEINDFDSLNDGEFKWYNYFKKKDTPVIFVINKIDLNENTGNLKEYITHKIKDCLIIELSAKTKEGMGDFKKFLVSLSLEEERTITGNLVKKGDMVLLVMPQDIQAPKGRLILPQVQTIRELLDKKCKALSVTTDQYVEALDMLKEAPKLIITDSQVFDYVYENKPKESLLTSFSVLFAALKGDINYYLGSVKCIDKLTENSKVLIAECCSHAPLEEDIGREKIPKMLKKRIGDNLTIDIVSGNDFPENLKEYDLIIQCGACMFNRKYVMSRVESAISQGVPMTNYGVTIAYIKGILEKIEV